MSRQRRGNLRSGERMMIGIGGLLVVSSIGFFGVVTSISVQDPGYFDRLLLAGTRSRGVDIDPMLTGSTVKAKSEAATDEGDGTAGGPPAIPVPEVVRSRSLRPQDFQIVMVFGSEAHLASPGELWRVRVGSLVPGLGKILAIEPGSHGGTVKAENATLKGVLKQR